MRGVLRACLHKEADCGKMHKSVCAHLRKTGLSSRSIMDRTEASDAFDAGSIPVGCMHFA